MGVEGYILLFAIVSIGTREARGRRRRTDKEVGDAWWDLYVSEREKRSRCDRVDLRYRDSKNQLIDHFELV